MWNVLCAGGVLQLLDWLGLCAASGELQKLARTCKNSFGTYRLWIAVVFKLDTQEGNSPGHENTASLLLPYLIFDLKQFLILIRSIMNGCAKLFVSKLKSVFKEQFHFLLSMVVKSWKGNLYFGQIQLFCQFLWTYFHPTPISLGVPEP